MDNKQFIILIVVVLICCCIVAGAIYFGLSNQKPIVNATANVTADNNTTNVTANLTEEVENAESSSNQYKEGDQYKGQYLGSKDVDYLNGKMSYEQAMKDHA